MVIIESAVFTRQVQELLTDDEYARFQYYLAANPKAGDVVKETGGLRKVRWNVADAGKRGGVRVIYFHADAHHQIRMLLIYSKGEKDDLSVKEKKILRAINRDW